MSKQGMHCFVAGKVQGVWFRASTKTEAESLGLTGWTRNLPDGRVEVMAFGDEAGLEKLQTWLKHGPPLAKVSDLVCEEIEWRECVGFEVID